MIQRTKISQIFIKLNYDFTLCYILADVKCKTNSADPDHNAFSREVVDPCLS